MMIFIKKYDLTRFKSAQKSEWDIAYKEICAESKDSHWIWYIFPQLKGLGMSWASETYGIASLEEAIAYLSDEYLRRNLTTITKALLNCKKRDIVEIVGYPDNLKICSCMTLFYYAADKLCESNGAYEDDKELFKAVIDKYYGGLFDERTKEMLG